MKKIQFIDEKTRKIIKKASGYIYGVVFASKDYCEYGWFKSEPTNIMILLKHSGRLFGYIPTPGISREALPDLVWSKKTGYYMLSRDIPVYERFEHEKVYGYGNFPYQFPKRYEAAESFHLFKDAQQVINNFKHPLTKHLKYTFGLEFETSMGYIPQELCFRDGLIPLRDGSISGIEYSTVVLEGNKGLCLLKQELDTLKEYTKFNKECALHIHMGGYPVNPIDIFALYCVWFYVERNLETYNYVPRLSFKTEMYKDNGKSYCKKLTGNPDCFEDLFSLATGKSYLGSLTQPHPKDVQKRAKWNINTRYYGLNLINMLCYNGPKTVEFRFLRPTFNYRKIILWLYILNAVLKYAEHVGQAWREETPCPNSTSNMFDWIGKKYESIESIIQEIYGEDKELTNHLFDEIKLLQYTVIQQTANGDLCGRDTFFEDEIFT